MNDGNVIEVAGMIRMVGGFMLGPLDFEIQRGGGVLALIGNNGAGKTTLLDLLFGLGRPDFGSIKVLGHEHPRDTTAIKARTAYVNPDMDFSAWGTVDKALQFLSGFYPDWSQQRCDDALRDFALDRRSTLKAHSFGERMKFLLVTALARDPDLLLLDEPTIGLDVHAQEILADRIGQLRQRESRTIVISSHQLGFLEQMADQVALLHQGRLLAVDRIDSLLDRYRWLDALLPSDASLPDLPGFTMLTRSGDRARCLLDRANADRTDLERLGVSVIEETKPALQELVSALTRGD